jgi:arylsulfatase A-like enzyme
MLVYCGPAAALAMAAAVGLAGCRWLPTRPQLSVVLIVIDTLRADHLGLYGYSRTTSPSLDQWGGKGVVFEQAHASSPWTLPSFGSIYTGQLPSQHRAGMTISGDPADQTGRVVGEKRVFSGLDPGLPTLAEVLRDHGYETAAVVNNVYLHPMFGVARGFQDYDYVPGSEDDFRPASVVVDRALAWVDAHGGTPFFLLIHLMDPHMNYNAPPPFRGRFTGAYKSAFSLPVHDTKAIRERAASMPQEDRMFITAAYDEEVAFADHHLGRLLEGFEQRHLLAHAVVVLTADHGEELFDHNGFTHGHTMYEELLHVPLMVWAPGARPARLSEPVELVDVDPTILQAVGLRPPTGLAGISLWPAITRHTPLAPRPLYAENTCIGPERKAIIQWPYKLVFTDDGSPLQLFDLTADAEERSEVNSAQPDVRRRLLAQLQHAFAPAEAAKLPEPVQLDVGTRERLRALGYLE